MLTHQRFSFPDSAFEVDEPNQSGQDGRKGLAQIDSRKAHGEGKGQQPPYWQTNDHRVQQGMIDYSLRSCVERGITVRRCKNCGRYFPQTGRVSAEYCERPVPRGQQTCREAGAFQQWTKKQSDDPVFKAYRKEYKKRFAWIKAGRISDTDFYAWSERAREMKKKCDRDVITLEEYVEWLKNS